MAFFKDDENKKKKKEDELITDFNTLLQAYETLKYKISETKDQSYESILPIREYLYGEGQTPDDTGVIGKIRIGMTRSNITRLKTGGLMWNSLDKIKELDNWFERHSVYNEKFIDDLQLVVKSAFFIVGQLYKENKELELEIEKLKNEVIAAKEEYHEVIRDLPKMENLAPLSDRQIQELYDLFNSAYKRFVDGGSKPSDKGRLFTIIRGHPEKRGLVETWFEDREKGRAQLLKANNFGVAKKNEKTDSEKQKITPNPSPQESL